jgi:hypothetical protein
MSKAAVERAREIGRKLAARPEAVAMRKQVWREMGALRAAIRLVAAVERVRG